MEIAYGKWMMGMDVEFGAGSAKRAPLKSLIKYTKIVGIAYFLSIFRQKCEENHENGAKTLYFEAILSSTACKIGKNMPGRAVNRQNIQSFSYFSCILHDFPLVNRKNIQKTRQNFVSFAS